MFHCEHQASHPVTKPTPLPQRTSQRWCFSRTGSDRTALLPPCVPSGKALSFVNRQYFSDSNGNRGAAPNVVVVLVDGWPTDKVEDASRLARESGINIFFVTIEGPDENEKLNVVEANFVDKVLFSSLGSEPFLTGFSKKSSSSLGSELFLTGFRALPHWVQNCSPLSLELFPTGFRTLHWV